MVDFLSELRFRNETLFTFGFICLIASIAFLLLTKVTHVQLYQVNAWFKPFKFAFSTFLFSWAMAWYCYYLPSFTIDVFNWSVILLLSFEIIYIAIMSAQGKPSHYNVITPFYAMMFSLMALAATLVTVYTAYVGLLFFTHQFPDLPSYYVWGIRLGITVFVIFSFEGFLMGGRMSHTVGLINNNSNLPIVGWSRLAGDLRIAHFIGMHALQVLPILAFYILKSNKAIIAVGLLYGLLAAFTLVQALHGRPLIPMHLSESIVSKP